MLPERKLTVLLLPFAILSRENKVHDHNEIFGVCNKFSNATIFILTPLTHFRIALHEKCIVTKL